MREHPFQEAKFVLAFSFLLLVFGCTESGIRYDDIDLKMKFDADQLQVKFGSTEKIMLADMLKAEGDIKLDADRRYYLVEEATTEASFQLRPANCRIEVNRLNIEKSLGQRLWGLLMQRFAATGITTMPPGGWTIAPFVADEWMSIADSEQFRLNLQWEKDVKELSGISFDEISFLLQLEMNSNNAPIAICDYRNIKVALPDYIVAIDGTQAFSDPTPGQAKTRIDLGRFKVKGLQFSPALTQSVLPAKTFGISGEIKMCVTRSFTAVQAPEVALALSVTPSRNTITPTTLTGIFSPDIASTSGTFQIGSNVPDFLQDESVRLLVSNPTLHCRTDLTDIPAAVHLQGMKVSTRKGGEHRSVNLAAEGLELPKEQVTHVYFHQGGAPYAPNGVEQPALLSATNDLGTLIERVPDTFEYTLERGALQLAPQSTTVAFGKNYTARLNCRLLVPFAFNRGFRVLHTQESDPLDFDRDDLSAENFQAEITAQAVSTIPLELDARIVPLDKTGNPVKGVSVSVGKIPAASTQSSATPLRMTLRADNADFLRQIDRFRFVVAADATDNAAELRSDQYLQLTNAVIRFQGAVIQDFN